MASLSYLETLKIFIYAVMTFSVAAAHQDCSKLTSVKDLCNVTSFPDLCYNSLVPKIGSNAMPQVIYKQSAEAALAEVSKASLDFAVNGPLQQLIINKMPNNRLALSAMQSCREFFNLALNNINRSLSLTEVTSPETHDSIRTWLSAADADLETCQDGFGDLSYEIRSLVIEKLKNSTEYIGNSLAIITEIDRCACSTTEANKTWNMGQELSRYTGDHTPYCLSSEGRKPIQATSPNSVDSDLVMAKVGSGN